MAEEVTPEQLEEYENELANVKELLEASPDDESLLTLRKDLEELVAISRNALAGAAVSAAETKEDDTNNSASEEIHAAPAHANPILPPPPPLPAAAAAAATHTGINSATEAEREINEALTEATTTASANESAPTGSEPPKKKTKKIKEFEVPERLVPLETDSEAEKKRKRRAIKALKSQWREKKKEVESENKKQSWQSFKKKKGKKSKEGSIFSTHDGDAKVGVATARKKTEFGGRQRHK